MSEFAKRLKIVMDFRQKTQTDIAVNCNIDKGNLSHYLKGDWLPKQNIITKIAEYLEVSPAYLLGITDDMFYEPTLSKVIKNNVNVQLLNEIEKYLLALDEKTLRMVCEMVKALVK